MRTGKSSHGVSLRRCSTTLLLFVQTSCTTASSLGTVAVSDAASGQDGALVPTIDATIEEASDDTANADNDSDGSVAVPHDGGGTATLGDGSDCDAEPCGRAIGEACSSSTDCASRYCSLGYCHAPLPSCSTLPTSSDASVDGSASLERTWPSGNPAGQAVLVGGQFDTLDKLCFDDSDIDTAYRDSQNAMILIPSDAGVGTHHITAITTSGAVSTIPVNVASDFGPEPSVKSYYVAGDSGIGVSESAVFGASAVPYIPTAVGNYPPLDNFWADEFGGPAQWSAAGGVPYNHYGTWDGGISFSAMHGPFAGGLGATRTPERLVATVSVKGDVGKGVDASPDSTTANYVGLFVCGGNGSDFSSIASSCGYPATDAGDAAAVEVLGNPSCQVQCGNAGQLRVLLFPDAPTGHQVLLLK